MIDRAALLDRNFVLFLEQQRAATPPGTAEQPPLAGDADAALDERDLLELYESQVVSRHLDLIARELRRRNQGFYTIGSAGHEGNAVIGRLARSTDPALLHYRSGALMAERARNLPGCDFIRDTLLSLTASREDPIAGGRHKVWGSRPLWVLPQTSTIASHLPKALGIAFALERAKRLGVELPVPRDSVVLCSFGDGSIGHSTAQGAFNAAAYASHQRLPLPLLFICEDNGLGISLRTPGHWISSAFAHRYGLHYIAADGLDPTSAWQATREALDYCRARRRPVFLHLEVVRLLGHAGSDVEQSYRPVDQIERDEARDPLRRSAQALLASGTCSAKELLTCYERIRKRVQETAQQVVERPRLESAAEVIAPLAPYSPQRVALEAARAPRHRQRLAAFGDEASLPEKEKPRHMAALLNRALADLMARYPQMVVFGEDVAGKGGVYHVTAGLQQRFGAGRVFDTLIDESSILGLAQGLATVGFLPVAEIQYLAYLHNAIDQLRGEACSQQFFSNDQFRNPMVVRIAAFGYQKGFGGHFHNDNSIAALRDIPGLIIAAPARGDDAVRMLRSCAALAQVDGRVVAFLEPIARYMTRDLYEDGDGGWLNRYPSAAKEGATASSKGPAIPLARGHVYHPEATELAIISYANGVYLALRAARRLAHAFDLHARVVDLRWLAPLDEALLAEQARSCRHLLIVDEGRRSGGMAEPIIAALVDRCGRELPPLARLTGEDTYIPLGPAAELVLPSEQSIVASAVKLCRGIELQEEQKDAAPRL